MPRVADLWKLQEIDTALDARRASLEDARARIGESEDVLAARARADELAVAQTRALATQKDIDLEAGSVREKIAAADQKLYGGTIKNPKELADLQADIEQLKRQLSSIEDRELEAIAAAESADQEVRAARAELETIEAAWRDEQGELRDRLARLTEEVAEYQAVRDERAEDIEPDLLNTYDRLRGRHPGRGVAKLDRSLCTGCRISLPVSTVNKARAGSALVQCPNCERILFA